MKLLIIPAVFVGALLLTVILSIPSAWLVMLLLGVAHSLEPAIPAFGFLVTWVLVLALRITTVSSTVKE